MPERVLSEIELPTLLPCLCVQTRRVDRLLNRIYDDALRPLGITTLQKALLANVGRHPEGMETAELCRRLALDRSTLTRNLTTLQHSGLVTVSEHQHDRRKRVVELTDAGRRTHAASEPLWIDAQRRVVSTIGYDRAVDMTVLLADVEQMARDLES